MEFWFPFFVGTMCLIGAYFYYQATNAGTARGVAKKWTVPVIFIEGFLLFMSVNMYWLAFNGKWIWE